MATTTIAATKTANSLGTLQNGDMILGERVSGTGGVYTITTTGTGDMVLKTSPTLVTPLLGTPTSGTLTNCTGLPVSTGIANLATGMATFLATPTSANLAATLTDETGTGAAVFATSPTLVTPLLGTVTSGNISACTSTSMVMVTPLLGTPTSGILTNCTGLPIGGGGTGVTSVTTTPAASSFAGWDASKNFSADSFIANYATTATAAGTTTLTVDSVQQQYFTGVTTQTVVMPVTSTLVLGQTFRIVNTSTGTVTIQSSGANNIIAAIANSEVILTCILTSGTTAASWQYQVQATDAASTGTGGPVRATSPTFVTPLLGTPTSGVLTSCTGLPVEAVVSSVTGTTPAAGIQGQILSASATGVAITSNTNTNITSISLTAGNWIVTGSSTTEPAAGTTTQASRVGLSTVSATFQSPYSQTGISGGAGYVLGTPTPVITVSGSGSTTIYLVGLVVYAVSTLTIAGAIKAIRIG